MLLNLHVKNMALIQELELDFQSGLHILTGETGAGKSILIGSINVALGMQSFKNYARDEKTALVELVFSADRDEVRARMEELELPLEDNQVIFTRRLTNGRSISKVNGETVPVSVVRELASMLIDIHGQHEHQSLLYKKYHLQVLDEFAKEELLHYREKGETLYTAYAKSRRELEESVIDEAARSKEMDFLQFEIEEIDAAALITGEDEELETRYRKMSNARKIAEYVSEAYELTANADRNAADMVSGALQKILYVSEYDSALEELGDQLGEIESLLSDFIRELSAYMDDLTFDEQSFREIEDRLDTINRFKTKYGNSIEEILAYRDERQARLDALMDYDVYRARLAAEYEKNEAALRRNAEAMSRIRQGYASKLSEAIRRELVDLNFLETNFEIVVEQTAALSANGFDEACFMMSMNPGSPMRPLGDVASGGELSRIMLAIKTVLADKDQTETLIFDEIDVGISGRTAQKVSEKMAVIAQSRQVLCITHLAQIASMADHHYYIEKSVHNQQTVTGITELSRDGSIDELARILGGAQITDTTLQSAREMKEMAEQYKSDCKA